MLEEFLIENNQWTIEVRISKYSRGILVELKINITCKSTRLFFIFLILQDIQKEVWKGSHGNLRDEKVIIKCIFFYVY